MSALTDLFTALANKIRSKTGGSATYTPPQMVAAIDDVYDAGVAAGTKPTQTKSAGPNVSTNKDVTPDSGYLLSKVTITPLSHTGTYTPAADTAANDMGEYHDKRYVNTSGMIVPSGNKAITANGSGIDVKSFSTVSVNVPSPTINSITPSNSSPAAMSSGNNYSPTAAGYAISSYSSVTPSSSGASFSSGMVKMDGNGYAYSSRPTVKKSTTTLWTNSAPTSNFDAQVVTLSSSMQNYDYLIITFKASATSTSTWQEYVNVSDFVNSYYQSGGSATTGAMASGTYYNGSGSTVYTYNRPFSRRSNTQISFSNCRRSTTSSAANYAQFVVPTKIEGMYYYT